MTIPAIVITTISSIKVKPPRHTSDFAFLVVFNVRICIDSISAEKRGVLPRGQLVIRILCRDYVVVGHSVTRPHKPPVTNYLRT